MKMKMRIQTLAATAFLACLALGGTAQAEVAMSCEAFDTPGTVTMQDVELTEMAFRDSLAENGYSPEIASFLNDRFYRALACKASFALPANTRLADAFAERTIWELLDGVPKRKGKSEAILDILTLLRQTQAQQGKPAFGK
ncbi:hypothetical protein [Oricola sp.]|uniref:hypothetical protein n=1 Tax=Oricola sp. TaxID=1979950 RepID=UPI0025D67423|nr:hypothetical protein [Oricola sp.]MCI5078653.1 hypothetical protein [Oricola sp.]